MLFRSFDPAHTPIAFPSPRSWEYAHRALQKFDKTELLADSLMACVGQSAGLELKTFVDNMAQMPDLDAIINGEDAEVPEGIDLQYGVAAALVRKAMQAADSGNATAVYGNILKYAQRFQQREMGVMLVSDLHRAVGRPLFAVPAFSEWANSITDLVLYEH